MVYMHAQTTPAVGNEGLPDARSTVPIQFITGNDIPRLWQIVFH